MRYTNELATKVLRYEKMAVRAQLMLLSYRQRELRYVTRILAAEKADNQVLSLEILVAEQMRERKQKRRASR